MTPQEAADAQLWRGMDGATAWHLIDRHADNWDDVAVMMGAWANAQIVLVSAILFEALDIMDANDPVNAKRLRAKLDTLAAPPNYSSTPK